MKICVNTTIQGKRSLIIWARENSIPICTQFAGAYISSKNYIKWGSQFMLYSSLMETQYFLVRELDFPLLLVRYPELREAR